MARCAKLEIFCPSVHLMKFSRCPNPVAECYDCDKKIGSDHYFTCSACVGVDYCMECGTKHYEKLDLSKLHDRLFAQPQSAGADYEAMKRLSLECKKYDVNKLEVIQVRELLLALSEADPRLIAL